MRLNRIPMLYPYKELYGQFIFSTMNSELAFLDAKGHIHLFKSEIQGAILEALMEREVKPAAEFLPQINSPAAQAVPKMTVSGSNEAFVSLIERIAKAFRG